MSQIVNEKFTCAFSNFPRKTELHATFGKQTVQTRYYSFGSGPIDEEFGVRRSQGKQRAEWPLIDGFAARLTERRFSGTIQARNSDLFVVRMNNEREKGCTALA